MPSKLNPGSPTDETDKTDKTDEGAFCTPPRPRVPPRLIAGVLLLWLALRFTMEIVKLGRGSAQGLFAAAVASLALGASLWWVAHRQIGTAGAVIALSFLATSPLLLHAGSAAFASLGLFAMLFTAVGVAHALQGPRRKWPPRILLMSALVAFTSAVQPLACLAGLVLAALAMLYLAESKRLLLPYLFIVWIFVAIGALSLRAVLTGLFSRHIVYRNSLRADSLFMPGHTSLLWQHGGLALATVVALSLWLSSARSRYFGNSAPLLAALALIAIAPVVGLTSLVWSLPFLLLFIAGVAADGLQSRGSRFVSMLFGAALVLQAIFF